jgi:hypothetical protein
MKEGSMNSEAPLVSDKFQYLPSKLRAFTWILI